MIFGRNANGRKWAQKAAAKFYLLPLLLCSFAPETSAYYGYDYGGVVENQQSSQSNSANVNSSGKSDSKNTGVQNAMTALNNLAALNIPGAFYYGYKGYGNYINYQKLDGLKSQTINLSNSMDSINNTGVAGGSGSGSGNADNSGASAITGQSSPQKQAWSNMDTGFLFEGQTGAIAADFEQKSGMSRTALWQQLASAVDSGLSWNDPNIYNKLESRYQNLVNQIPNPQYKAGLQQAFSMLSLAKKFDILAEGRDFYLKNRFGDGSSPPSGIANIAGNSEVSRAPASEKSAASENAGEINSINSNNGGSAAAVTEEKSARFAKDEMGMYLGLEGAHQNELNDMFGSLQGQESESIFRMISKHYRKITPSLLGRESSMLGSK